MVDIETLDSTERDGSMESGDRLDELGDTEFLARRDVALASVVIESNEDEEPSEVIASRWACLRI